MPQVYYVVRKGVAYSIATGKPITGDLKSNRYCQVYMDEDDCEPYFTKKQLKTAAKKSEAARAAQAELAALRAPLSLNVLPQVAASGRKMKKKKY